MTSTMYKLHLKRGGKYEDFKWYLDIMEKEATSPHAGYGIGNDRVLQYILGEKDIRNTSLFSLFNSQTGDWAKARYGQAGVLVSNKKHILLSVGKEKNKQSFCPTSSRPQTKMLSFTPPKKPINFLDNMVLQLYWCYKISEIGTTPNISDLLQHHVFDTIINIPTNEEFTESKEFTDGRLIRKGAIAMGTSLITNVEVAAMVLGNLRK